MCVFLRTSVCAHVCAMNVFVFVWVWCAYVGVVVRVTFWIKSACENKSKKHLIIPTNISNCFSRKKTIPFNWACPH